jgi:hypothetical protein
MAFRINHLMEAKNVLKVEWVSDYPISVSAELGVPALQYLSYQFAALSNSLSTLKTLNEIPRPEFNCAEPHSAIFGAL